MPEIDIENKPCSDGVAIVIFGVTGDLARRKLLPGLYENAKNGRLPDPFYIIGFARRPWSHEKMRNVLREGVYEFGRTQPIDDVVLEKLLDKSFYVESTFEDQAGYQELDLGELNLLMMPYWKNCWKNRFMWNLPLRTRLVIRN